MLHYRNHGGQVGEVLAGVRIPQEDGARFDFMIEGLGYTYFDETANPVFTEFMRYSFDPALREPRIKRFVEADPPQR
eukprot:3646786-Prymnesium_polylepis.1